MSRRAGLITTFVCVALLAAASVGVVAVRWFAEQWSTQGQRQVTQAARATAVAAARQAELGLPAHAEPVARARVLASFGRVLSIGGDTENATFLVEIQPSGYDSTPGVPAKECYRIDFDAWQGHVGASVPCPDHAAAVSLPPPPTTLPSLGENIEDVRHSISALSPSSRRSTAKVEAAITAVVRAHGAAVDVSSTRSIVGAAIRRDQDHDCVLVRIAADVEIWRPASVYGPYGQPGETSCSSASAIARDQQQPPH
jgi:hypothetical protein